MIKTINRGFGHIAEAYQTSFDELRNKIQEKLNVEFQSAIALSDFIHLNLDSDVVLSNITQENIGRIIETIFSEENLTEMRGVCSKNDS